VEEDNERLSAALDEVRLRSAFSSHQTAAVTGRRISEELGVAMCVKGVWLAFSTNQQHSKFKCQNHMGFFSSLTQILCPAPGKSPWHIIRPKIPKPCSKLQTSNPYQKPVGCERWRWGSHNCHRAPQQPADAHVTCV
jgi:hypothetical protein